MSSTKCYIHAGETMGIPVLDDCSRVFGEDGPMTEPNLESCLSRGGMLVQEVIYNPGVQGVATMVATAIYEPAPTTLPTNTEVVRQQMLEEYNGRIMKAAVHCRDPLWQRGHADMTEVAKCINDRIIEKAPKSSIFLPSFRHLPGHLWMYLQFKKSFALPSLLATYGARSLPDLGRAESPLLTSKRDQPLVSWKCMKAISNFAEHPP